MQLRAKALTAKHGLGDWGDLQAVRAPQRHTVFGQRPPSTKAGDPTSSTSSNVNVSAGGSARASAKFHMMIG